MKLKSAAASILLALSLSSCANQNLERTPPTLPNQNSSTSTPTPTPLAFKELTIPYLRQRTYQSSLGELKKYTDTAKYSSYLTSYDSEGFKINALVTKPKGETPIGGWPAIIFVHGYIPPNQYQTTTRYIDHVNSLASNGIVVLKIDLRGHGDSEGEAAGGYYSSDYVIDTLNAYAALQNATEFINPRKIGLWGHSMAGNVTFRAFVAKQNIPAIVIWAGAGYTYDDLREYRISDNSYRPQPSNSATQQRRRALFDTHGEFSANSSFWQQVVPTNYLENINGAVQLHHATDDAVVSIKYSQNLDQILNKTSLQHSFYTYQSGGHNLVGPTFTQAMQRTVDFFQLQLSEAN